MIVYAALAMGPGTRLDRYEIVREIAQGGMGIVWLARFAGKHGFEKRVAIKTMLPELAADSRFRTMFLDEARISSRLVHANVAQILDVGESDGTPFIVFEWVDGMSLEEICRGAEERKHELPVGLVLRVVADACAGLHAAHELRDEAGKELLVVHRDVKPENILVGNDGAAKVIDFGVAKAKDRMAGETRSGIVKGTPHYMAPEQAAKGAIDRRADIWSLGAVLHRAFAGRPPFADMKALGEFVLGEREPAALGDRVPAGVRSVVRRAMQRHAGDRYATADEMRRALETAMQEEGSVPSAADVAVRLAEIFPERRGASAVNAADRATAPEGEAAAPRETKERREPEPHRRLRVALVALIVASALVTIVAWFVLK